MRLARAALDPYGIKAARADALNTPPHLRWYRQRWFWLTAAILTLVIGMRVALNPVATALTRKALTKIEGYTANIEATQVSVVPFHLTVRELVITQNDAPEAAPIVFVEKIEAQLLWRKLFQGRLVALAAIEKAKFVVTAGVSKTTPQMEEAGRKASAEVKANDFDFGAILQKVVPLKIDRIEVSDSEFTVIDGTHPKAPSFWVSEVQLVLDNLVTRPQLDENVPLTLTLRSKVAKTGVLKMLATADLLADKPAFTGQAQLAGLRLESLNEWTMYQACVSDKGVIDVFANFNSAKGKLGGDVKLMVRNAVVEPATSKVSDALKAGVANLAIKVLSDRVQGRDAVATTLPIRGSLENPDPQVWPTILGVVRNAFVQGLDWGFGDLPKDTADKPEGIIKQTAQGLDKDDAAPKAQPTKAGN